MNFELKKIDNNYELLVINEDTKQITGFILSGNEISVLHAKITDILTNQNS